MTSRDGGGDTLSAAIIKLRKKFGSQTKLGAALGVTERTVKRWESGDAVPQQKHRPALTALGVDERLFLSPEEREEIVKRLRRVEGEVARLWQLLG